MKNNKAEIYWKKNLTYLTILLSIWFVVSFGFGILLADHLNEIQFLVSSLDFGLLNKVQYTPLLF